MIKSSTREYPNKSNQHGISYSQYRIPQSGLISPKNQQNHTETFNYSNSDTYVGEWEGKVPHGKGTYTFANSHLKYLGMLYYGKLDGYGKLSNINSNLNQEMIYDGEWRNGMRYGQGIYIYGKDHYYNGSWVDNHRHGKGEYRNQSIIYVGHWLNNERSGSGTLTLPDQTQFTGIFTHDQFINGKIKYPNQDYYEGSCKNWQREGQGKYYYSQDASIYQGQWKNNLRHGFGMLIFPNKDQLRAYWNYGLLDENKQSMYRWSDGTTSEGYVKNGSFIDGLVKLPDGQSYNIPSKP